MRTVAQMLAGMFIETRDSLRAVSITRLTFFIWFWVIVYQNILSGNVSQGAQVIFGILLTAITGTKVATIIKRQSLADKLLAGGAKFDKDCEPNNV